MLENLSERIRECYRHAEDCQQRAKIQTDPSSHRDFLETAERWLKLAQSYEFMERLTRFVFTQKARSNASNSQQANESERDSSMVAQKKA